MVKVTFGNKLLKLSISLLCCFSISKYSLASLSRAKFRGVPTTRVLCFVPRPLVYSWFRLSREFCLRHTLSHHCREVTLLQRSDPYRSIRAKVCVVRKPITASVSRHSHYIIKNKNNWKPLNAPEKNTYPSFRIVKNSVQILWYNVHPIFF